MKQQTAAALLLAGLFTSPAFAQNPAAHTPAPAQNWSFQGLTGRYDTAALQRGYQVYGQVCASCHGMKYLRFSDLRGIGLTDAQIRSVAAEHKIPGGKDPDGKPTLREATPADPFPTPAFPQEGKAPPPDMSRLVAVWPGGPDRIYALLTGYGPPPEGVTTPPGMFYNRFALAHMIAMPPPLRGEGTVQYTDGTKASLEQEARDVTTFLAWASDPHLNERHRTGVRTVLYLGFLICLFFLLKKRIWARAERKTESRKQDV